MSYSDIVGSISGLLQFVVACYALRASRTFGIARVGWSFFGAFTLLAVVHTLISVHPFRTWIQLGPTLNILYEIISVLLLANIAQMEILFWKRRQKEKAEAKAILQVEELTKAKEELQQTAAKLQAEIAQHKLADEQPQPDTAAATAAVAATAATAAMEQLQQAEKSFQEQLALARQSEEALKSIAAALEAELIQQRQAYEQSEKSYQEQLAAARQSEATLTVRLSMVQTELLQQSQTQQQQTESRDQAAQMERTYQEQLAAAHKSEEELVAKVAELQVQCAEQKQKQEQTENTYRELMSLWRQSGIAEVATLAQSRVAYMARITNLMRAHSRDIGKFMTRNPRGKQLPTSLALLLDYLADEQSLIVRKMDSVKRKVEEVRLLTAQPAAEPVATVDAANANPGANDFNGHFLANVTETGTEGVPETQLIPTNEETAVTDPETNESPAHV